MCVYIKNGAMERRSKSREEGFKKQTIENNGVVSIFLLLLLLLFCSAAVPSSFVYTQYLQCQIESTRQTKDIRPSFLASCCRFSENGAHPDGITCRGNSMEFIYLFIHFSFCTENIKDTPKTSRRKTCFLHRFLFLYFRFAFFFICALISPLSFSLFIEFVASPAESRLGNKR